MIEYNGKAYICPMELAVALISGKWKAVILWNLIEGPLRFGELYGLFPEISQKMLTQQLKGLEQDGLISREVYPEVPPRVDYSLTDFGKTLTPILQDINLWGKRFLEARYGLNEE